MLFIFKHKKRINVDMVGGNGYLTVGGLICLYVKEEKKNKKGSVQKWGQKEVYINRSEFLITFCFKEIVFLKFLITSFFENCASFLRSFFLV